MFSFQNMFPINNEIFSDHVNVRSFVLENCLSLKVLILSIISEMFIRCLSQPREWHIFGLGPLPLPSSEKSVFSEQLSYINGPVMYQILAQNGINCPFVKAGTVCESVIWLTYLMFFHFKI